MSEKSSTPDQTIHSAMSQHTTSVPLHSLRYATTHYIRTTSSTPVCYNTLHPYHCIHSGMSQHIHCIHSGVSQHTTSIPLHPLRCVTTHYSHTTASTPVCQHTTSVPLHPLRCVSTLHPSHFIHSFTTHYISTTNRNRSTPIRCTTDHNTPTPTLATTGSASTPATPTALHSHNCMYWAQ